MVSRKRATKWYLAFLYTNLILTTIKGVVIVPIYLKFIDPRLFGAWLACGGIVGYFGLLEFGVNRVIIQRVAESAGSSDTNRLEKLIGTGFWINALLSFLPLLLGLSLAGYVPAWFQIQGVQGEDLRHAFILAALAASLMMFSFAPAGIMQALQRQVVINLFFTGGSTHPGNGLPLVLLSARLTTERIFNEIGAPEMSRASKFTSLGPARKVVDGI